MNDEVIETLNVLGFHNEWENFKFPYAEYYNKDQTAKICLKGDGMYAYSVDSFAGDYLEMHLNFIPQDLEILEYIIRKTFYL